jgi:hypothetical protein
MYRDDRLEYKKGSLLVKKTETTLDTGEDGKTMQKQRRSTKFDFSGTNYEILTMGYLAGIEDEHNLNPDLFTRICDKAKKALGSGARKPAVKVEDKFASIRLDPAFLARASLRAKISSRAICKNAEDQPEDESDDEQLVDLSANEGRDASDGNAGHGGLDSEARDDSDLTDLDNEEGVAAYPHTEEGSHA